MPPEYHRIKFLCVRSEAFIQCRKQGPQTLARRVEGPPHGKLELMGVCLFLEMYLAWAAKKYELDFDFIFKANSVSTYYVPGLLLTTP